MSTPPNLLIPDIAALARVARSAMAFRGMDAAMLRRLAPLDAVRMRYLEGDCFEFAVALRHVTGWSVSALETQDGREVHQFAVAPDGRWLDASGWFSRDTFAERHGIADTRVSTPAPHGLDDDDDTAELLVEAIGAMRHFTWPPFCDQDFRKLSFRAIPGVDIQFGSGGPAPAR